MAQTEIITSTGAAGVAEFNRSEGRAYLTIAHTVSDPAELVATYTELLDSSRARGRRRTVLRARCSPEVVSELSANYADALEVSIPLNLIDPTTTDSLVVLGRNVHTFDIPEWDTVYDYWQNRNGRPRTPASFVEQLPSQFQLVKTFDESDIPELRQLWNAFGWSNQGLSQLRGTIGNGIVFSGVRDKQTGKIVSASMGEILAFAGVNLAETTEYSTNPAYRGHSLCTASVVGLTAQLLNELDAREGIPLILAELNMSSRSDVVAYHAGLTIPEVESVVGLAAPRQVLRANVSVLDGMPHNDLNWRNLGLSQPVYGKAFAFPHRYLRNFIVGVMPGQHIESFYGNDQRQQILSKYE
ncbi:MAG: hypothetical protein WBO77_01005 [Microgenomates group bacterium]